MLVFFHGNVTTRICFNKTSLKWNNWYYNISKLGHFEVIINASYVVDLHFLNACSCGKIIKGVLIIAIAKVSFAFYTTSMRPDAA